MDKSRLPFELIGMGNTGKNDGMSVPTDQSQPLEKPNYLAECRSILSGARYFMRHHLFLPLRYLPKASLYYLHSPLDFPAVYYVCKKYKVPFIYDAHDFYIGIEKMDEHASQRERLSNYILFKLESSCIKHAAAVVTVCDGVARLQEETFKCHPVVARNCHDYRLDQNPRITLRQLLGLSADDFLLVTIGQAKKGQAISESLDAMRKLPSNVHLAFVGKNTEQYTGLIRQKGLDRQVHAVPPVMPFEVIPFVRDADASLIIYYSRSPNYENCLPNAFFQAIAAGLPLLYPELPEIEKIARHYKLGISLDPRDPESIVSGVLQLMTDHEHFLTYRENSRLAREELSWEQEERILCELVSTIIDKRSIR